MHVKTILNRVHKFKSFVYTAVYWVETSSAEPVIEAELRPCANGQARCGWCLARVPGYDRQPARRFEFVPLRGMKVYLRYAPRRVACPDCGVKVEHLPWASGKRRLTEAYAWFLARWAKRLSYKEVAEVFRSSWDQVFAAVERAVQWGRAHQDLSRIEALGIDEIAPWSGHRYLPLVYQIDPHHKRLLWVGEQRTVKTLLGFFRWLAPSAARGCDLSARTCGGRT